MSGELQVRIEEKSYTDINTGESRLILHDVGFSLRQGELIAVVGPSGCGKSTLLHLVAGLDQDFKGRVEWPAAEDAAHPHLGYVFQNPRLLPWLSVRDNIRLVLKEPDRHAQRIATLLDATGLSDFADFHPQRLSLGMQRRVALARALVVSPFLLIMDEPFVSLDDPTADQLRRLLLDVWDSRSTAVLFVTHDLREAVMLADRILFLSTSPARVIDQVQVDIPRSQRTDEEIVERHYRALKQRFNDLYLADRDNPPL